MSLLCPYCHAVLTPGDVTRCSTCSAPHHRECWVVNDGCAVPLCAGRPTSPSPGRTRLVVDVDTRIAVPSGSRRRASATAASRPATAPPGDRRSTRYVLVGASTLLLVLSGVLLATSGSGGERIDLLRPSSRPAADPDRTRARIAAAEKAVAVARRRAEEKQRRFLAVGVAPAAPSVAASAPTGPPAAIAGDSPARGRKGFGDPQLHGPCPLDLPCGEPRDRR